MHRNSVRISLVCGVYLCLGVSGAFAHGIVGKRKFIEPFVGEDANPKDEFVLAKPGQFNLAEGNAFSVQYLLEKRFTPNFSLTVENAWTTLRRGGEEEQWQRGSLQQRPSVPRPERTSPQLAASNSGG